MSKFTFLRQIDSIDCGAACLRMIFKYYGKFFLPKTRYEKSYISRQGLSMLSLKQIAMEFEMNAEGVAIDKPEALGEICNDPFIVHFQQNHFIVVLDANVKMVKYADPSKGILKEDLSVFWQKICHGGKAYALLLSPTPNFKYLYEDKRENQYYFSYLYNIVRKHYLFLILAFVGLLINLVYVYLYPILKQAIVDIGIADKSHAVILYMAGGYFVLLLSQMLFGIIQEWLTTYFGTRVNMDIFMNFFKKLTSLPISFFESCRRGDLLQKVYDSQSVENFLTRNILKCLLSITTLIIFSVTLLKYNITFFYSFYAMVFVYSVWMLCFVKKRQALDWKKFDISSNSQSIILQLINGIQDIKLYNSSAFMLKQWQENQIENATFRLKSLKIIQLQEYGAQFIHTLFIVYVLYSSSILVIDGHLTMGEMISIEFIIGQMFLPINDLVRIFVNWAEVKMGLQRIFSILNIPNECAETKECKPVTGNIRFQNCTFRYIGQTDGGNIKDLSFEVKQGQTVAIVGHSGCGKSTTLKLLLSYYRNYTGEIMIGDKELKEINPIQWRDNCGLVSANNYIFNKTIAQNLSLTDKPDMEMIDKVLKVVNMYDFVYSLPAKLDTKLGDDGKQLSQGQQQRLFIARLLYKNPNYILLDEATNALDADNEQLILDNIREAFSEKTIIVAAHRLSTIMHANQILVMEKGEIVECGDHESLMQQRGKYYDLFTKQICKNDEQLK